MIRKKRNFLTIVLVILVLIILCFLLRPVILGNWSFIDKINSLQVTGEAELPEDKVNLSFDYNPQVLLVKFKEGASQDSEKRVLKRINAETEREIIKNLKKLRVNEKNIHKIKEALEKDPAVEFVEYDALLSLVNYPNDAGINSEYHVPLMRYPGAWNVSTGKVEVLVSNPDTGYNFNHPDLKNILVMSLAKNTYDGTTNVSDVHGHGTYTAGCIAAHTNNSVGIAAAPWKAKIIPIRITNNPSGTAYISDMAEAARYAADNGAKVVSISYGGAHSSTMDAAGDYVRSKGGLLFMSAGNDGTNQSYANWDGVITVSATTSGDTRASFSNYGSYVDLAAPGYSIYTTSKTGYGSVSGTSFSSPLAASVATLLFSAYPTSSNYQIEQALLKGAKDLGQTGWDVYYGWGRVDALGAIQQMGQPFVDTTPPSVLIQQPPNNQTVEFNTNVEVQASDNYEIKKIELYLDNILYATKTSGSNGIYSFYLEITNISNGVHYLMAKAYDSSDNSNFNSAVINVLKNVIPPSVSIISPVDGAKITTKTFSVKTSTSNTYQVDFYINNNFYLTDTTPPFEFSANSRNYPGNNSVRAVARAVNGLFAEDFTSFAVGTSTKSPGTK